MQTCYNWRVVLWLCLLCSLINIVYCIDPSTWLNTISCDELLQDYHIDSLSVLIFDEYRGKKPFSNVDQLQELPLPYSLQLWFKNTAKQEANTLWYWHSSFRQQNELNISHKGRRKDAISSIFWSGEHLHSKQQIKTDNANVSYFFSDVQTILGKYDVSLRGSQWRQPSSYPYISKEKTQFRLESGNPTLHGTGFSFTRDKYGMLLFYGNNSKANGKNNDLRSSIGGVSVTITPVVAVVIGGNYIVGRNPQNAEYSGFISWKDTENLLQLQWQHRYEKDNLLLQSEYKSGSFSQVWTMGEMRFPQLSILSSQSKWQSYRWCRMRVLYNEQELVVGYRNLLQNSAESWNFQTILRKRIWEQHWIGKIQYITSPRDTLEQHNWRYSMYCDYPINPLVRFYHEVKVERQSHQPHLRTKSTYILEHGLILDKDTWVYKTNIVCYVTKQYQTEIDPYSGSQYELKRDDLSWSHSISYNRRIFHLSLQAIIFYHSKKQTQLQLSTTVKL